MPVRYWKAIKLATKFIVLWCAVHILKIISAHEDELLFWRAVVCSVDNFIFRCRGFILFECEVHRD